jgi:type IV pilus assembly protein PilA
MEPASSLARRGPARAGFSLVELAVVVGIVGILASIALPIWTDMQLRAKRAEPYLQIAGIATAEDAYYVAHDSYVDLTNNPGTSLTKAQRPFKTTLGGWQELGYQPDGEVRCNYRGQAFGRGTWYRVDANCDIDDDNKTAIIRYYGGSGISTPYFYDLYPDRY